MREGRLGYNSYNKRYGLLSSDLWIDTGFHCGECLEVLLDDEWVQTRMEMNPAREWYLVGTPYCGDLEFKFRKRRLQFRQMVSILCVSVRQIHLDRRRMLLIIM